MKKNDIWKRGILLLLTCMLCLLAACEKSGDGKGGGGNGGIFGKNQDLSEDTPWNHGRSAIMETENGWYTTGLGEGMCLRYLDKSSKESILLCNKPECTHEGGDTCEATYRNLKVVNACLYEGFMYLLGWEGVCNDSYDVEERDVPETEIADSVNLSLYRAALDGSAIDKVGTVFETDNLQHQRVNRSRRTAGVLLIEHDDSSFIIHKGVAYISLYLQLGEGSMGLRGAGLYKMDLSTGALKEIEKYETLQSRPPAYLTGVSDDVYYYRFDPGTRKQTWYRYVISEDRLEAADPLFSDEDAKNEAFGKKFMKLDALPYFTAERSYWLVRTYQESENGVLAILAVDAKTQKILPEESFETGIEFSKKKYRFDPRYGGYYSLMGYDGKFFIADLEKVYVYDLKGNQVGEISVPWEVLNITDGQKEMRLDFKISNEKLYLIFGNGVDEFGFGGTKLYHRVMSCPLEKLYQGKGEWTDAYRLQGMLTWTEYRMKQIEEYTERLENDIKPFDEDSKKLERERLAEKIKKLKEREGWSD